MKLLPIFASFLNIVFIVHTESVTEENVKDRISLPLENRLQSNECSFMSGTTYNVGLCVPIRRCDVLYKLLEEVERRPELKPFLRSLRCNRNKASYVCCPYSSFTNTRQPLEDPFAKFLTPPSCGKTSITESRILGGEISQDGAWPWIAALGYRTFENPETAWHCGGTIISDKYILTAAHCLKPKHPEFILHKVKLGGNDLTNDSDGFEISIDTVIPHPNYTFTKSNNDIGLIKLKQPINFTRNVQPICLPKTSKLQTGNLVGHNPFVIGWGVTNYGEGAKSLSKLMQAQIPVIDNYSCNNSYSRHGRKITNEQICTYDEYNKKDACQGDSGGPLILHDENYYYIIGVVSFGFKCGEPGYPGVYTRVTSYLNWISSVIS